MKTSNETIEEKIYKQSKNKPLPGTLNEIRKRGHTDKPPGTEEKYFPNSKKSFLAKSFLAA